MPLVNEKTYSKISVHDNRGWAKIRGSKIKGAKFKGARILMGIR